MPEPLAHYSSGFEHGRPTPLPDYHVMVLLVDDQAMVCEAVRRALANQTDMDFHYCADAREALAVANQIKPTVILQDLVMPGIDGLTLLSQYRASPRRGARPHGGLPPPSPMRAPDDAKAREILRVAAGLFAGRPFHEVRIDDVAAAARVSKGTVYTYYDSKEDLYVAIILDGVDALAASLRARLEAHAGSAADFLREMVREMVAFGAAHPEIFRLLHRGQVRADDERGRARDAEIVGLIETAIRRGVARHEFTDPRPHLTARLLSGSLQQAFQSDPEAVDPAALCAQVEHVFLDGLRRRPRS